MLLLSLVIMPQQLLNDCAIWIPTAATRAPNVRCNKHRQTLSWMAGGDLINDGKASAWM
jgi:hypothetical protein